MTNPTVQEVLDATLDLETYLYKAISDAVRGYTAKTGLTPESIDVQVARLQLLGRPAHSEVVAVRVNVNLK